MMNQRILGRLTGFALAMPLMGDDRIYLTVDNEKRPEGDGYIAIISHGSPQLGDSIVTVLDVTVAKNMKSARAWYRRQMQTKPWETRQ